ncbi:MAG: transglutaminase-like domain-containing protein [Acidobacteriota bacterium]
MRPLAAALTVAVAAGHAAGADEMRLAVPTALAARIEAGERGGLLVELERVDGVALVTVSHDVSPLAARPSYPLVDPAGCGDPEAMEVDASFAPPEGVAVRWTRTEGAFDVVVEVVAHVTRRVTLDESDDGPQDAASVQARGRGRCSGRANLAVALLRVAGIPARVVHGLLVGDERPRWHRWGEAWLPGAGWIAFDPGSSVGAVSVRHVPLRGAGEGASIDGVRVLALEEGQFARLPKSAGLRVVPDSGATLRCRLSGADGPLVALLVAGDGTRWARRGPETVEFPRLLPGPYTLRWWTPSGSAKEMELDLDGVRVVRLD